jgi:hypothetical protein
MFRVIGCKCYPFTRHNSPHKLAPRSSCCVLLEYSHIYKGYKCLDLQTNKILISKHVLFNEHTFPFKDIPKLQTLPSSSSDSTSPLLILRLADQPITKVYTRRPPTTPAPSLPLKPSSLSLSTHHM